MSTKDTNPKDLIGSGKAPLSLIPLAARIACAEALANGMGKYGKVNWRASGVRASVYLDAIERHLCAFTEGEDFDEEGVHNLGAIMACCSILLDVIEQCRLTDDRPLQGGEPRAMLNASTARLAKIHERNAKREAPHHYTRAPATPVPAPADLPPRTSILFPPDRPEAWPGRFAGAPLPGTAPFNGPPEAFRNPGPLLVPRQWPDGEVDQVPREVPRVGDFPAGPTID